MNWNCEHIETRLSDYVDGLLSAEERRLFTAHTATCANCAGLVRRVGGFVAQLHAIEAVEEPPRLAYLILDKTLGPRKTATGWRGIFAWMRPGLMPRLAMGTVAMLLVATVMLQSAGLSWAQVQDMDWRPRSVWREANRQGHLMFARSVKFVNDLRVVYEIQTRLQTAPEPATVQPQPAPGSTEKEPPKRERDMNRADEKAPPVMLASVFISGVPGRSIR